jgi:hypothetical protein
VFLAHERSVLTKLNPRSTLRVALLAALALLVAQFGAQAHAYSHIRSDSHASDQLDDHGRLCSECSAFAPLLSTAGSPSYLVAISPQGVVAAPAVTAASLISERPTPAFRSRAPPSRH